MNIKQVYNNIDYKTQQYIIICNFKYNNIILQKKIYNNEFNTTLDKLYKQLFEDYKNVKCNNIHSFFICNNKLCNKNTTFFDIVNDIYNVICKTKCNERNEPAKIYNIECFTNLSGGGDDILDMIMMPITMILDPIIGPILSIGKVFIFLLQLIVWFAKFILWFVFFVIWIFSDLLNPVKIISDFWNSMLLIIITIISTIFNTLMALIAFIINGLSGWMQGFWGWDQSNLTKNDINSNYFKSINRKKGKKCYLTNTNTVPFSILLGTILCPPIGVFMNLGITGWFNILICILLTLLFYIPGLFYALLIIYA